MSFGESFRRAIGLRPSFRRSSSSILTNIMLGSFVGVISGKYIFEEPIKEYWEDEQNRQQAVAAKGGGAVKSTPSES